MKVSKLVAFDVKRIISSWLLYLALGLSFLAAFGIAYSIKHLSGPFTMSHITSFYAMFGSIFSAVIGMRLFSVDLSSETISLLLNTKTNRVKYGLSKMIGFGIVGLIFGIACAVTVYITKIYTGVDVEQMLYWKSILNYVLFTMFYAALFFTISLFYRKVTVLFVVAVLAVSFLPNLLDTLLQADLPAFLASSIEHLPLYFFPIYIGSHNLELLQYGVVFGSIALLAVLSFTFIQKQDY
ncbi:hypothetical protein JNUCC1_01368 [Lentibacillus sp. JNUCC-1]|uniref:ABC transporter permease subunit n=1 Tax=Lentibacillus sp. JNUCC-1 TaxID=2654513 RepID=UPI0012E7EB5F|nr:ABC transporter permease subunit [Lentibacillus sp. JNUCC-1]MUV37562.1 hypothetical protein [Lentibacillus sp. JNUCC-1]